MEEVTGEEMDVGWTLLLQCHDRDARPEPAALDAAREIFTVQRFSATLHIQGAFSSGATTLFVAINAFDQNVPG